MMTKRQLIEAFHTIGLQYRDTVLIHSSLRKLGPVEGGADTVIDALLDTIGSDGLVAVPTHTWATVNAQQPVFHETLTPSTVGALTNVFRTRKEAVRSLHPTHSVAAIGNTAMEYVAGHELDDTPCSPKSPYGKLIAKKGKVLLLGVGLDRCTFYHCLEEMADCGTWSLTETKEQLYSIAADGRIISVPSRRHQNCVSDNFPRLEEELLREGIVKIGHIGDCPLRLVDAAGSAECLVPWLIENTKLFW